MPKFNDINLAQWKDYSDIYTDSLWIINRRDNSGVLDYKYHGNFIPQIPFQLFSRYTKKGDWVLDPFVGSGTSSIIAQRMKRNSIGIDLQESVVKKAEERLELEKDNDITSKVIVGDSKTININLILNEYGISKVQFVILHPPYWDIIKFSDSKEDISNCKTLDDFILSFDKVVKNTIQYLEKNRYCALVIGDKYSNSQLIPLGFICLNVMQENGLLLKAIITKNIGETEGKANNHSIWRYRALASDYYVFKHEYIMIFKKTK